MCVFESMCVFAYIQCVCVCLHVCVHVCTSVCVVSVVCVCLMYGVVVVWGGGGGGVNGPFLPYVYLLCSLNLHV